MNHVADRAVTSRVICSTCSPGGRLTRGPCDQLVYQLKTPRTDGTTAMFLSPMALLERLARLIPQPGQHMTRYFGVLSSGAAWRARIIPKPLETIGPPQLRPWGRRLLRADLSRRVFVAEVVVCACGGTGREISSVEQGPAARKILQHLGLSDALPVLAPARIDQSEVWPTGPPLEDHCDPPWTDEIQQSPPRLRCLTHPALPSPSAPPGPLKGHRALPLGRAIFSPGMRRASVAPPSIALSAPGSRRR